MKPIDLISDIKNTVLNTSGIYMIYNFISNKAYIGQAINIPRRKREHFNKLSKNKHENPYLQNSYNKYGEQAFKFIILENCEKDKLIELESKYIACIDEEFRYNLKPVEGISMLEETRKKISDALKGIPKNYKRMHGKKHSEETKRKMSDKAKLRVRTEEHQKNLTESIRKSKKGKIPWNKGMKMSKEHCNKLSIAHLKKDNNAN